ncbi:MAG: alpha-galactosidase [Bacilli bacterium]
MIFYKNNIFCLSTTNTSYVIRIDETKHVLLEYYGNKINEQVSFEALFNKWSFGVGSSIINDKSLSKSASLDLLTLEVSTPGKGDYNSPSLILKNKNGYVYDFLFEKYEINKNPKKLMHLPSPFDMDEELVIFLQDKGSKISLELHYVLSLQSDVISRNIVIKNTSKDDVNILKAMSMELTINNNDYEVINLYGGWSGECKKEISPIKHGTLINDSKNGSSSNRHNPFFMVKNKEATLNYGEVLAFNLVYSGNHYESIERNFVDQVRIETGISPYCFDYLLKVGEVFETPFEVMTYSNNGINGASQNMHNFINNHIVNKNFKNIERPILVNNWEATTFDFNENKLLKIAKIASNCGIELFVLDDGWFKGRDNDNAGLGDYEVNKKKLPHGLDGLAKRINKLGMKFGLWFEPEMVNADSDLYRAHPDYIVKHPDFVPSEGRNQFCLDLTKKEVQDYIILNVNNVISSANISYVKWDYNRPISDFYIDNGKSGEFFYRYILGLYRILKEITIKNKDVLFEGCSSGGNRFDLGMLCYFPQTWASDNTDALERNYIQSGLYLGYPLSTIGAHVSDAPSHSVLRNTPFDTRFNVASFGDLGYELDLTDCSPIEIKAIKEQVKFYKEHRKLLQYGNFYQFSFMEKENHSEWMVLSNDKKEAIIGYFNGLQKINPSVTFLTGEDFNDDWTYKITVRHQEHNLKEFGGFINTQTSVHLNPQGLLLNEISKRKTMSGETETYTVSGSMLNSRAIKLKQEWSGTGFDDSVRLLGDFGSRLYYIKKV